MADFSISITVPNDKVALLVAALRAQWGPFMVGPDDDIAQITPAQLRVEFKRRAENMLRREYIKYTKSEAASNAVDIGVQ